MKDSPTPSQDAGPAVAEIREKIRKARAYVSADRTVFGHSQEAAASDIENLRRANEEFCAAGRNLAVPPPSPPTLRGRAGGFLIRSLSRLFWWQQLRWNQLADASAHRNDEEFKQLETLTRRVRELEAAQLKSQSAQVDWLNLRDMARAEERIEEVAGQVSNLAQQLRAQAEAEAAKLDRRISGLAEGVRQQRAGEATASGGHELDAVYAAFEDAFRGTREQIKEKQAVYIPILQEIGAGGADMPVLDLGCGRGEWLELLQDHHLTGRGVDRNGLMLEACRSRGLAVEAGDAATYLSGLPSGSLGAITGFHLIEHIPFQAFIALLDQSLRLLKPGGIVIFETPNPGNFHVGVQNFYMDPTHLKPLPSAMTRFFVEARGFSDVRILELHPYPASLRFPDDANGVGQRLNEYLYGAQDYAVIGRKAR